MKTFGSGVKLIIFMLVTTFLTFMLAATIGNFGTGKQTKYSAQFSDVTGLLPGNEVRIAGVRVGKVKKVGLKDNLAEVVLSLEGDRRLTSSDVLQLRYRNLVGERYIAIVEGAGGGRELKPDAIVPLAQTRDALDLTVLFNGFRPLLQALDPNTVNQVSFEIIQTLQGEGGTIDQLLRRTASLTNTLADKDAVIGRVIDNLGAVLATVDRRDADLNALILQVRRLSAGFAQDRATIGASIAGIADLTDATAGLVEDIRPPLRSDIKELRTLAGTLDDNKAVVDGVLQRLPAKLNAIISTATYGGWFNFYLCGVEVDGQQFVNSADRCKP